MDKLPIPDDFQPDSYVLFLVCCPSSTKWQGALKGQIWKLANGRFWDERTGRVKDAQKIGRGIFDSLMSCKLDELVAAVAALNTTIQANQALTQAVVTALNEIKATDAELEDDLANVWRVLQSISQVLGGEVPQPPNPL